MELKHYRLIKTIVEEGNLANSSEKLFLTQSALSHQLREIEKQLDFKVFIRSRNQWTLTEQGSELYQLANTIFEAIERGFNEIKNINDGTKGQITISTGCYHFCLNLPDCIQQLAPLYPAIDVNFILEEEEKSILKLINNEIDLIIGTAKKSFSEVTSTLLFEDEIFAVMHRDHPLAQKDFLTPEDFQQVHLVIHSFPLETVSVVERFLKPVGVIPAKISAIPLTEVALALVNAKMGIMCVPLWILNSFKLSESHDLVLQKIGSEGLQRKHYLLSRTLDTNKKYIQDFISTFTKSFGTTDTY